MVMLVGDEPMQTVSIPLACAGSAFVFIFFLYTKLWSAKTGKDIDEEKIDELSLQIKSGAIQFLKTEYYFLTFFVAGLAATLFALFTVTQGLTAGMAISSSFVFGATLSASAGWWGMMVATDGNAKTTAACAGNKITGEKGTLNAGLKVAFTTGAVMGFAVVGLGLAGACVCYTMLCYTFPDSPADVMQCFAGFGFGASSIALFARVAGGIYTKAADVGADLVGKVEAGIDEDDPHNPAVIADNVGDNVGDVAGMGADLFESYVGSVIAACTLAVSQSNSLVDNPLQGKADEGIALAFMLPALGIICSILGYFAVNTNEEGKGWNVQLGALMWALEKGMYVAAGLFVVAAYVATTIMLGLDIAFFWCVAIGLGSGVVIGKFTEYFTSFDFGPVISIKDRGMTGPATVVIQGLGVGMISTVPPVIVLAVAIVSTSALGGPYGVAISAVGMLATLGITLATDAYGPVADNAGGLAELAYLGKEVRAITDSLDALGNTTAATGKGFAIGSAVLTALSLLSAFKDQIGERDYSIGEPIVLGGALVGAMLPYLFAALTMISVGKAAAEIIQEVRHQFATLRNADGFLLGDCIRLYTDMYEKHGEGNWRAGPEQEVYPDSDKCVVISTRSSVREMIAPGAYAVLAPLIGGFLVGPRFLIGLLAGAIASGCMLAIMMANAGGAWDNSKKLCEKLGLKKSKNPAEREQQKATVVGDTVGDPFKDTSGPALNILIKLMSMVSLTVAPLLTNYVDDFQYWPAGLIPLGAFVGLTMILIKMNILTWDDPLNDLMGGKDSYTSLH